MKATDSLVTSVSVFIRASYYCFRTDLKKCALILEWESYEGFRHYLYVVRKLNVM